MVPPVFIRAFNNGLADVMKQHCEADGGLLRRGLNGADDMPVNIIAVPGRILRAAEARLQLRDHNAYDMPERIQHI